MGGVLTTMCGMAECAAMAATRRCRREGCWPKTDGVTVVLVRIIFRVPFGDGLNFFYTTGGR
jgi:hypothetical protein